MGGTSVRTWGPAVVSPLVRDVLAGNGIVRQVRHVGEVASTQDTVLELARAGAPTGTVVVADVQRSGRGRSGNRWDDDPAGGGLALSLLLDAATPPLDASVVPLLPQALGLAVIDACASVGPDAAALRLKWPNDVVRRYAPHGPARKLAGVLIERDLPVRPAGGRALRDVLCCGIGMNVALPAPLLPDRLDLATVLGAEPDRVGLLAALLRSIDRAIGMLATPAPLLERLRSMSDTVGRDVRVRPPGGTTVVGRAVGIDDDGRLLVTASGRIHAILSGNVRDVDDEELAR